MKEFAGRDVVTGLRLVPPSARVERRGEALHLTTATPLDPAVETTAVWLHRWAAETPEHVFLSERAGEGWRDLTYAQVLGQVRAVAASLVARGLGPDTPIAILSGNGVDHAILSYAAQYVGVPTSPSPSSIR